MCCYAPPPADFFFFLLNEGVNSALLAYKEADSIAHKELPATHPVRLGVALNFSVFYFEVLNSPDRACDHARQVGGFSILLFYLFVCHPRLSREAKKDLKLLFKFN